MCFGKKKNNTIWIIINIIIIIIIGNGGTTRMLTLPGILNRLFLALQVNIQVEKKKNKVIKDHTTTDILRLEQLLYWTM